MSSNEFICKFCGKPCKNRNSLAQHQIRCSKNPDKISTCVDGFNNKGRDAWNKGKSGIYNLSEDTKQKIRQKAIMIKDELQSRPEYEEYRKRMSSLAKERAVGGFHFRRGVFYNGVKLDSSYEVVVAESLDANNIFWERPGRFPYHDNNGILHYYTPDFYLPEYNIYLDPKNDYLIEHGQLGFDYSDKQKIDWVCNQNGIRVLILDKDNLTWEKIRLKI